VYIRSSVFVCALIALLGPTVAGYIFDGTGSYFSVGFLTGIPYILSIFFLGRMLRLQMSADKSRGVPLKNVGADSDEESSSSSDSGENEADVSKRSALLRGDSLQRHDSAIIEMEAVVGSSNEPGGGENRAEDSDPANEVHVDLDSYFADHSER